MSTVALRIFTGLFLLFSSLFLPWWLSLLLGALFIFAFSNFFEFFALALILDLLYGGASRAVVGIPFFISFAAVLLYLVAAEIKKRLLIYRA